jgi:hypothetical protein
LIQPFLDHLQYPAALHTSYEQRLRYGLEQYYLRRYHQEKKDTKA